MRLPTSLLAKLLRVMNLLTRKQFTLKTSMLLKSKESFPEDLL